MFAPGIASVPTELTGTICPNCGYALAGLGANDRCPECGRAQNPLEVVLYGWARGEFENIHTAKPSRLWWAWMPALGIWLLQAIIAPPARRFVMLALAAAAVIYINIRRRDAHTPGQIQVRIYPYGCVQFNDNQGPSPLRELIALHGWKLAIVIIVGLALLIWRNPRSPDIVPWCVALGFTAIVGAGLWRQARISRKWRRSIGPGAIIDANAAYYGWTPWKGIRSFTLKPVKPGRYRLQITPWPGKFWLPQRRQVVDAEVELPDGKAAALVNLLKSWGPAGNRSAN